MVKMIVTDLDRTLLRDDKTVSKYSATVLRCCQQQGIKVAFATARPERATKRFQENIVPDYVIADNGATISNGDIVIRYLTIPSGIKNELMEIFLASDAVELITVEAGDCVFTNYGGPPWDIGWNIIYNDFLNGIEIDTPKISVECKDIDYLYDVIHAYPNLHLYANSGENWCQIMMKDASKTNAIRYISKLNGFNAEDIAAFGDDFNDIEMLEYCGIGIAMENAIDHAKAVADFVCDTNNNDGVAKWIDENILSYVRGE